MKTTNQPQATIVSADGWYTARDAGCYVDASRGIYTIDRIIAIARSHGMGEPADCSEIEHCPADHTSSGWAGCEFAGEVEDECDDYMNEHQTVDGHYWGRSEQGDWGLWEIEADA